jgi:glutaredoxin
VNVARDKRAAKDLVRISGQQGVPVIQINGRPIVGFDRAKIDRMLGLN